MAWYVWVPIIAAARRGDEGVGDVSRRGRRLLMGRVGLSGGSPEGSDLELFRAFLLTWNAGSEEAHADLADDVLQGAIDGAKEWIAGRRWSWKIVAANYLRDGKFHA